MTKKKETRKKTKNRKHIYKNCRNIEKEEIYIKKKLLFIFWKKLYKPKNYIEKKYSDKKKAKVYINKN